MGSTSSKEQGLNVASTKASGEENSGCPYKPDESSTAKEEVKEEKGGCPYKGPFGGNSNKSSSGFMSCPVTKKKKKQENDDDTIISKANNMPAEANQSPAPNQNVSLPKERVASTIPKSGEGTWLYPSPQMFYNALVRKNKLDDDTTANDMESVVALHNNMNERTWKHVLEWEKVFNKEKSNIKLTKFIGRPQDLSPKARLKHFLLGHPLPFDRHDWTVEREDGTTVRYIIDYYHDETKSSEEPGTGLPGLNDRVESLLVDVRPALDSPSEFYHRAVLLPWAKYVENSATELELLPLRPSSSLATQVAESQNVWENVIQKKGTSSQEEGEAKQLAIRFGIALEECQSKQSKVAACQSDVECQQASLDLLQCFGKLWCPVQHQALLKAISSSDDSNIEKTLEALNSCVVTTQQRMGQSRLEYPKIWEKVPKPE
mmetsp:Transcript_8092/g.11760  ORF Transcript_8092/g.11760 Transcript_8092/m.11760 type:complete len:432 (+) Transcript_8092:120-1415(+)